MPDSDPDPAARRDAIVLSAATALLLLPFLAKPSHIDDHLFLVAAEQIRRAPLDFFGTTVNWYGRVEPFHRVTQNPPGASYVLALLAPLGGIVAMHAGFALAAIACVLGVRTLARDLAAPPLLAGFCALAMPVFLVSSTTLMSDVPMTALFTWAVVLWLRGLERDRSGLLVAASLAAAAAVLTKYFAVALLPLFVLAAVARRRPLVRWAPALAAAIVPVVGYEVLTRSLYGAGHLTAAFSYAAEVGKGTPAGDRLVQGVVFAGGCVVSLLACAPLVLSRRSGAAWLAAAAAFTGLLLVRGRCGAWALEEGGSFRTGWLAWSAVYGAAGALAAWIVVRALAKERSAGTLVLAAWVGGTFVFAALVNWTMNGRSVLPMVPPLAVLAAAAMRGGAAARALAVAPGIAVSLVVAHGDLRLAGVGPQVAAAVRADADVPPERIWFQGHWGFQTAMESIGARPLEFGASAVRPGDLILLPHYGTNVQSFQEGTVQEIRTFDMPVGAFAATMSPPAGCGFYSTLWGPLPFVLGPAPSERYSTFVATRPFPLRADAARGAPR